MNENFNFVLARELYESGGELEVRGFYQYANMKRAELLLSTCPPDAGFKIYKLVELDTNPKL